DGAALLPGLTVRHRELRGGEGRAARSSDAALQVDRVLREEAGGAGDEPSGGQQHGTESVGKSRRHRTILLWNEPVRSALPTAPELEDIRPAGRQRQRDRRDGARELTERTTPALLDPLDVPAAREPVRGRVEGEGDGGRLSDDAREGDGDAPVFRAPRAGDRRGVARRRHGRPPASC